MNRLVDKGAVRRSADRPARYAARIDRQEVSTRHLDLLLQRMTQIPVVPLVAQLISSGSLSPEEIQDLKTLIAQAEASERKRKPRSKKASE